MLLYRRNKSNGTWVVKAAYGRGAYWTKAFADADGYENSDDYKVLTFYQAQDKAKHSGAVVRTRDGPITVAGALDDYATDLKARAASVNRNARWPKTHLTGAILAKPVQLLSTQEPKKWRDGLLAKIGPATINRICNALCARWSWRRSTIGAFRIAPRGGRAGWFAGCADRAQCHPVRPRSTPSLPTPVRAIPRSACLSIRWQ